jgi:dihydroflavonol-4-reductase
MAILYPNGTDAPARAPSAEFWRGRLACVTGGSGFLGYHLVGQLLELGARVRILALPPPPGHPLHAERAAECFFGDVRDAALVRQAVAGCDVVFHTAAVVAFGQGALQRMHEVNREGTRNVLDAVNPDTRLVHTSSIVTVGARGVPAPLTEDSPFLPDVLRIDYVRSKRLTEDMALEGAGRRHVVVTNPGFLLGPEDYAPSDMGRFCVRFWKGRAPFALPGGINVVDVRDVARGHLLAAEHGKVGRRYILGGEDQTFAKLMRQLADVAGLKPRWLPRLVPLVLDVLALLAAGLAWPGRKEAFPSFQHAQLSRFCWFASSDRAGRELGYRPRPLLDSLVDTYRWYRSRRKVSLRPLNRWWMRPVTA